MMQLLKYYAKSNIFSTQQMIPVFRKKIFCSLNIYQQLRKTQLCLVLIFIQILKLSMMTIFYPYSGDYLVGSHCMLIIGVDNNKGFEVANSWNAGNSGIHFISSYIE